MTEILGSNKYRKSLEDWGYDPDYFKRRNRSLRSMAIEELETEGRLQAQIFPRGHEFSVSEVRDKMSSLITESLVGFVNPEVVYGCTMVDLLGRLERKIGEENNNENIARAKRRKRKILLG